MSFGELLRLLLEATDTKQSQLAAHLGYDVSYISRWVTGAKMPSPRNRHTVLSKTASFFAENSQPESHTVLGMHLSMDIPTNEGAYTDFLAQLLESACDSCKTGKADILHPDETTNCQIFLEPVPFAYINGQLADSIQRAAFYCRLTQFEVLILALTDDFTYRECKGFWEGLLDKLPNNIQIHISMVLRENDQAKAVGICHDILVMLFGLDQRIQTDFFFSSHFSNDTTRAWICKDTVCLVSSLDLFLETTKTFLTWNQKLINTYYCAGLGYLRGNPPLLLPMDSADPLRKNYLQRFAFHSYLDILAPVMPVLFLPQNLLAKQKEQMDLSWQLWELYSLYGQTLQGFRLIIYQSALIDFLLHGKAYLLGQITYFDTNERVQILSQLLELLKEGKGKIIILEDKNPILCSDEQQSILFLKKHDMICEKIIGSGKGPIYFSDNITLTSYFQYFFDEISNLPEGLVQRGYNAEFFLQQRLEMLL